MFEVALAEKGAGELRSAMSFFFASAVSGLWLQILPIDVSAIVAEPGLGRSKYCKWLRTLHTLGLDV